MKFCEKCNLQFDDEKTFCPNCGNSLKQYGPDKSDYVEVKHKKRNKWLMYFGSLFSVLVGVILFLFLKEEDPKLAKKCLIISIFATVIYVALTILLYLIVFYSFRSNVYTFYYLM